MAQQAQNTYKIPVKGLYTSTVADTLSSDSTPWCQNVRFRFGQVLKCPGRSTVQATLDKSIMDFAVHTDSGGLENIFALCANSGTDNEIRMYLPDTRQFGTPIALQNAQQNVRFSWTAGEEQLMIVRASSITAINNTPPSTVHYATNVPSPAGVFLEYFKGHTFLMNIVGNSNRIQWSALGNYMDWDTTQTHGGFLDLYDGTVEDITGGKLLGNRLVVYRASSIVEMTATGDSTEPFLPEGRVYGIGCMAPNSLASVGQYHIFLGNDFNIYTWDSVNLNVIGTPIHSYIRQLFDPSLQDNWWYAPFATTFMGYKEYWLIIWDKIHQYYVALIYDYLRDTWTRDTFPGLHALFEYALPGAKGSPGYDETHFPSELPVLMAANDKSYFMIDERIDGDRFDRPQDGGIDMFFDSPDVYYDQTQLLNGTLQRVLVSQGYPVHPTDPPYYLCLSTDRGISYSHEVPVHPSQYHEGFEFTDLNVTSNVRRYRFKYKATDGAGNPSWRAYTDQFVPSGPFFPKSITPAIPAPAIATLKYDIDLPPTGVEQGETGIFVDADESIPPDV